jgi:hypothetical protein
LAHVVNPYSLVKILVAGFFVVGGKANAVRHLGVAAVPVEPPEL